MEAMDDVVATTTSFSCLLSKLSRLFYMQENAIATMSECVTVIKPVLLPSPNGRQEGDYNLIHIPLRLYSALVHPILQVLLPQNRLKDSCTNGRAVEGLSSHYLPEINSRFI